jgi:hypothetical protein
MRPALDEDMGGSPSAKLIKSPTLAMAFPVVTIISQTAEADQFLLNVLARMGICGGPLTPCHCQSGTVLTNFVSTKIITDLGDLWFYLQIWGEDAYDDLWVLSVPPEDLCFKLGGLVGDQGYSRDWLYRNSVASFTNINDIEDLLWRWDLVGPLEDLILHSFFSPRGGLNIDYRGNLWELK